MIQEIINHNCDGLCVQNFCDEHQTHFIELTIHGIPLMLGFCKKHADEFDKYLMAIKKEC